jgi:hypothetical protein
MTKRVGALTATVLALSALPAAAQICAGFPTVDRQFTFGAELDFPSGASEWGVEASYNAAGPLTGFFGVDILTPDGSDARDTYFAGVALTGLVPSETLSICPVVQVGFTDTPGGSMIRVPAGLGFGTTLYLSPSIPLMPYVIPQVVYSRFSPDNGDSMGEFDGAIRAGALISSGMFFAGAEVEFVFEEGADPLFGIRAGIRP